jgi:zinc transport system substrate-binding protein
MLKSLARFIFVGLAFALGSLSTASAQARDLHLVVSIPPLAAMIAPLLGEQDRLSVLLDVGETPHGFQLKPSHLRQLNEADLVVSVGTGVDAWLQRALRNVNSPSFVAMQQPDLLVLSKREGGVWDKHDHSHGHRHSHSQDPARIDGHLWLSLENARLIMDGVAQQLIELDPSRAGEVIARQQQVWASLQARKIVWQAQLAPYKDRPFIVMHDAYQYFEQDFGLNAAGTIHVNPEVPPSVRRMQELRQVMAQRHVACVFKEPQFPEGRLEAVVRGTQVNIGSLDPLGFDGVVRPYEAFYDRLVQDFVACFK